MKTRAFLYYAYNIKMRYKVLRWADLRRLSFSASQPDVTRNLKKISNCMYVFVDTDNLKEKARFFY